MMLRSGRCGPVAHIWKAIRWTDLMVWTFRKADGGLRCGRDRSEAVARPVRYEFQADRANDKGHMREGCQDWSRTRPMTLWRVHGLRSRKLAERTVEATRKRIGTLLGDFTVAKCANYVRNLGYISTCSARALTYALVNALLLAKMRYRSARLDRSRLKGVAVRVSLS